MNDALLAFFSHRNDMTAEEAAAVLQVLAGDPALCRWLRDQLEMEDLLARMLQPERADFVNRIHAELHRGRDRERFVARVRELVSSDRAAMRVRAASTQARVKPAPRLARPRRFWLSPWSIATAASLAVMLTAVVVVANRPAIRHQVLQGDIIVGNANVRDIPDGSNFTVAGDAPAVVRLGSGSQAEFSPASTASIRSASHAASPVVQLDAGSGDFQVGQGGQELRVETSLGTITSSGRDGAFTATFNEEPATSAGAAQPGDHGAPVTAHRTGVLTVTVHTGSAHVEVKGKRQVILADEMRVFSMVGGTLTDERSVRGALKSLNPSGPVASVSVSDHATGLTSIPIGPNTTVLINGAPAAATDLKLGEHVDVRVSKEAGSVASLILVKRSTPKKPDPTHAAANAAANGIATAPPAPH